MLLDRKRINKWSKRVALALAIIFGVSFVALGVGSGTGVDWTSLWTGGNSSSSASAGTPEEQIKRFQTVLAGDPNNYDALLGTANQYRSLDQPAKEVEYLERAATAKPQAVLYLRLGTLYLGNDVKNAGAAVRVLNQATSLDPNNAIAFVQLGSAQKQAGNTPAAILAWTRYLEIAPNGNMAETVRTQLAQLTAETTATAGAETTATAGTVTTTK